MARLYDAWAYLEEVRAGSHSQLAVAAEQIEPVIGEVFVWLSSTNVEKLTDGEQDELFRTAAYLRRLKRHVLGIHDLARGSDGSHKELTAQFEQRLEHMQFPPEWAHVLGRLKGRGGPQEVGVAHQ
jgi:hypothetical protein